MGRTPVQHGCKLPSEQVSDSCSDVGTMFPPSWPQHGPTLRSKLAQKTIWPPKGRQDASREALSLWADVGSCWSSCWPLLDSIWTSWVQNRPKRCSNMDFGRQKAATKPVGEAFCNDVGPFWTPAGPLWGDKIGQKGATAKGGANAQNSLTETARANKYLNVRSD